MAGELGVRAWVSLWELVVGQDSIVRLPLDARFTESPCYERESEEKRRVAKSEGKQRQAKPVIRAFRKRLRAETACRERTSIPYSVENWVHRQAGSLAAWLADEAGHHFCILQLHFGFRASVQHGGGDLSTRTAQVSHLPFRYQFYTSSLTLYRVQSIGCHVQATALKLPQRQASKQAEARHARVLRRRRLTVRSSSDKSSTFHSLKSAQPDVVGYV